MDNEKRVRKEATGYRLVFGYLGIFFILIGLLTAMPLVIVFAYPEEKGAIWPFGLTAGVFVAAGILLFFLLLFRRKPSKFKRHQEFTLLTLIWVFAVLAGAFPFIFAQGQLQSMNFTKAIFESASGYTGTGLTGFNDYIDVPNAFAPHVFTYHRSQMQFIGGVGLVLLVASVLGANAGVKLYVSEGHSDKLLPNIARSAKLIFGIYTLYCTLGTVALYFAGLPWFEAVCTSMCALSGGGMSPRSANIGSYRGYEGTRLLGCFFPVNSLLVEIIVMILVILGMISFVLHTFILRGKLKDFLKDCETRYILITGSALTILAFFGACLSVYQTRGGGFFDDAGNIFRDVIFYTVGSFTTSGFAVTTPETRYHFFSSGAGSISLGKPLIYLCTLLMVVGADAGSTGGGIKQYRMVVAIKELYYGMRYKFSPPRQIQPHTIYRYGEVREIDKETSQEAFTYILLFLGVFIVSVALLCFNPLYDAESAAFDVASSMSNVGLGLVDYTALPSSGLETMSLWILALDMLLGRLEIMPFVYTVANVGEEVAYHQANRRKAREMAKAGLNS